MSYIENQLENVKAVVGSEHKPTIQISSIGGKTNHLSVSWETLAKIEQILLQAEKEGT